MFLSLREHSFSPEPKEVIHLARDMGNLIMGRQT